MEEVAARCPPGGERFSKSRRLLKRSDFIRVQKGGAGAGSRNYVVIALGHPDSDASGAVSLFPSGAVSLFPSGEVTDQPSRLGIVASRKTGNAVARNRGKRVVREWFRLGYQDHTGVDIVVILRSGAPELGLAEASRELDNGLRRAIKKVVRGP